MQQRFEPQPLRGLREHSLAHCVPVERAFGGDHAIAKDLAQPLDCRATRPGEPMGDQVGVDHVRTERRKAVGGSTFAAADASGQADHERPAHGVQPRRLRPGSDRPVRWRGRFTTSPAR